MWGLAYRCCTPSINTPERSPCFSVNPKLLLRPPAPPLPPLVAPNFIMLLLLLPSLLIDEDLSALGSLNPPLQIQITDHHTSTYCWKRKLSAVYDEVCWCVVGVVVTRFPRYTPKFILSTGSITLAV